MSKKSYSFFSKIVTVILMSMSSEVALACPECQFEQCAYTPWGSKIGCACLPNSGCVIKAGTSAIGTAANPLPDILNIGGAVVQGNIGQLTQAIGKSVIDQCVVCGMGESLLVSEEDKPFIEAVVGRGFIEFVTTNDPYIVIADAATSIATRRSLKDDPNPLVSIPSPSPQIGGKAYTASAASCLLESDSKMVVAGWVEAPTFTDRSTTKQFKYPNIQFNRNDKIILSSTNDGCPNLSTPLKQQRYIKNVTVSYSSDTSRSGSVTQMKQFLVGTESSP